MKTRGWLVKLGLCVVLSVWINNATVQTAELREEAIKELSADLAELARMMQPKLVIAKDVPSDQIVSGAVTDLLPEWLKIAKKAGFSEDDTIATMGEAFKDNSVVMFPVVVTGPVKLLKVKGKPEQLPVFNVVSGTWGNVVVGAGPGWDLGAVRLEPTKEFNYLSSAIEAMIKNLLDKINKMRKKYIGEGIIIKGFSVTIPPVAGSVNFEFEK